MNRRQLLKLLTSGVAGLVVDANLDIDRLLWVPNQKTIFIPSQSQIDFLGIPYHQSDASIGTWLGISRSTEPWPYKELMAKLCLKIDP